MEKLLQSLESHAGIIVMVLLAVLVLEVLIQLRNQKNRNRQTQKKLLGDIRQFYDEISKYGDEIFLLVRAKDYCVVYISENVEHILGIRPSDVADDFHVLEKTVSRKGVRQFVRQLEKWDRKSPFETEIEYRHLECDEIRWGDISVALTEDRQNYLCTMRDVTKQHKKLIYMEEEVLKAHQLDQSKTTFLSKMSHEIRTPMNGMLGMISLAKINIDKADEAKEYLEKAEGLSRFLLSIINDVLDMSRIESGKIELASERVDLFALGEKLKNMFQVTVEEKGVRFVLEMQDFTVRYVMGDELRISQVLTNFLSNSSKFTSAGGQITMTFRQMHIIDDKLNVMMRVRDTGKGMSSEFMNRIFNPFEQEDSTVAKKYGGSGLGMAIADNLVSLMGGQITVDSELGRGTDFSVFLELPIAEGEQMLPVAEEIDTEKEDDGDSFSLEGLRMLLAEDNKINALIAEKLLESQGACVELAVNGLEAVKLFSEHEAGYYQVILMDIQMPEMNGWEATRTIRAMSRPDAGTIPILALSADAFVEDKRRSAAMGMNGHVAKPIDFGELKQAIRDTMAENVF